ncbi:MAG TPA: hypothetical protein VI356_01930 [Myxococcales bacterium]
MAPAAATVLPGLPGAAREDAEVRFSSVAFENFSCVVLDNLQPFPQQAPFHFFFRYRTWQTHRSTTRTLFAD